MLRIVPGESTPQELHHHLIGAVGPRPIAFVSTVDREGNVNLAPFSFFNLFSINPPVIVFAPSRSVREGAEKDTLLNLREVGEAAVNVVTHAMVHQASLASASYPRGVSEFVKAGLTPVPSEKVRPPRVGESPVQMECVVRNIIGLGEGRGAGNLVISEIVLLHVDERVLDDRGRIDPQKIDLVARMGGDYYCRAAGANIFEVELPTSKRCIGMDGIPDHIRGSALLTRRHLAELGHVERLPTPGELAAFRESSPEVRALLAQWGDDRAALDSRLQLLARAFLDAGRVADAWRVLLQ